MQIIILGNGFDLASGLPTSYNDFFKWRYGKLKEQYYELEQKLNIYTNYLQQIPFEIRSVYPLSLTSSWSIQINEEFKTYKEIIDELKINMTEIKNMQINFFDLYFFYNNKVNATWNQIETEIFNIVVKNIMEYNVDSILFKMDAMIRSKSHIKSGNFFKKEEIYNLFLLIYLEQCKKDCNLNIYEVLLYELKAFESEFQKYINEISVKISKKQDRNAALCPAKCFRLLWGK